MADDEELPCEHVTTKESPIDCIICGKRLAHPARLGVGAIGIHLPAVEWLAEQRARQRNRN
jgi:hypothetical protein